MALAWWAFAAAADDGAVQHFIDRPTAIAERAMSLVGIFAFCGICWLMSENREKINWRTVGWGLALQVGICSIVLIPGLSDSLVVMSNVVSKLLSFTDEGVKFVFAPFVPHVIDVGPLGATTPQHYGSGEGLSPPLMNFAFVVLPTIVFFSALSNVLYYFGVLQAVVKGIAFVMQKTMGTSGAETLCTAANIFLGQTEAPLLVRPFIEKMTRSELMAVMVGGFATIAVGVLGLYANVLSAIPSAAGHLVVASIISAPATFVCCKIVVPETGSPQTAGEDAIELPKSEGNLMQAIAFGASDGMRLAINVAAMLIAVVALMAMVNYAISWVPVTACSDGWHGGYVETAYLIIHGHGFDIPSACQAGDVGHPLDLTRILGWLFLPIALLMGVSWHDAQVCGSLLGEKLVLTELVAYFDMSSKLNGPVPVMSLRTAIITAYALCGFANFASVGIQIGGIGGLAPNRTRDLSELGLKAMIVGSIATCMTGAVVGLFVEMLVLVSAAFARLPDEEVARLDYAVALDQWEDIRSDAAKALAADPDDLAAHRFYLVAIGVGGEPSLKRPVYQSYSLWLAEKPDDPLRRVALAMAESALPDGARDNHGLPSAGPWCTPALAHLDQLPDAVADRAQALIFTVRVDRICGQDDTAARAALLELAAQDPAAEAASIALALQATPPATVDDALLASVKALVTAAPYRLQALFALWEADPSGPDLAAARELALASARESAAAGEPAWLARMATGLLRSFDPEAPPPPPQKSNTPEGELPDVVAVHDALGQMDPQARYDAINALQHVPRDLRGPAAHSLWDAATTLGRDDEAWRALREWWRYDDDFLANLTFAQLAVARGTQLARATRSASFALDDLHDASSVDTFDWNADQVDARHREAQALDARAAAWLARKRPVKAEADANQALVLDEQPAYHLRLGLAAHAAGNDYLAFTELSRGLGRAPDDPLAPSARAILEPLWPRLGLWAHGDLDGFITAAGAVPSVSGPDARPEAMRDARVGQPFPDLRFTLENGDSSSLSAYPGVVVVDLWATWCGPCKLSLPHTDALARKYAGKVTVLALSVDDDAATARRHLGAASTSFVFGWLGTTGTTQCEVEGIPAIFVVDPERRVAAFMSGYGEDDRRLDDALAAILGTP